MKINNNFRWNTCPLCQAEMIDCLGDVKYRTPVMFSTLEIELKKKPELYCCKSCKSWFTQNIISEGDALNMYGQGESCQKWSRSLGFAESKSKNIIRRLDKYFHHEKRVLDVGCNTGVLLDYAAEKGCITSGVEPSTASWDVLKEKGHIVFPDMESVTEKYDVITAFDLVEHLHNLPAFFKDTEKLLVDGGVMIILTGDNSSLSARLSQEHWWYLKAPEHIVFPSINFFNHLDGFEVVSIDKTYASIGYNRSLFLGVLQYLRKKAWGDYEGLPSLGADHMLITLKKG